MRVAWGLVLVAGCGGSPFVIGTDAVAVSVADGGEVDARVLTSPNDAGRETSGNGGEDARVLGQGGEDADVVQDGGVDARGTRDADGGEDARSGRQIDAGDGGEGGETGDDDARSPVCAPIPPTVFGCGSSTYTFPAQYCAFPMSDVTVGLPTPAECQCAGHYTCECVAAKDPCAPTGQKMVSCQVGTTYGVVVVCK